ncbi:MAG: ADP-glyceromanno-heptose 6-epimerase [Bacteroidales bacterium]|jgi:ADP-L-glycero-D-manno-heptose 6-epimerase|nr:ADP-glyceromanno-heptose 6-epimerase [Bacteroidales bacterium]
MIVVTGAAGFIGSVLISKLNQEGFKNLILVDDFTKVEKRNNYIHKSYLELIERKAFFTWFGKHHQEVKFVFHIGARTDTAEFNTELLNELNLDYTKEVWKLCTKFKIPLVCASSAATYGLGEFGYDDNHELIESLKPLNPYGISKNEFDKWALKQVETPPFWSGLKFFNVYGPNEYHKARMASVIFHAFYQIEKTGGMKLFRSHNPNYKDGEQLRDFVYVKDVVDVLFFMMQKQPNSGIYNLGTGKARSFLDLVKATFKAMDIRENISFIDTPEDIRDKYQYFTEANMQKLINAGYTKPFTSLEDGVSDYVEYLKDEKYL